LLQNRASRNCAVDLPLLDFPNPEPYCAPANGETDEISMSAGRGMNFELKPATLRERRFSTRRLVQVICVAAVAVLLLSTGNVAQAQSLRQGISAFNRQDYMRASQVFIPLAERGDASAQAYLGFMFETGRGVPQNYTEAAMWYRRAAEQGDSLAQYSLGLLYDHGQGVPRDIVEANKWLNLSTAGAPRKAREARARIRDAVTTKMTRGEIARARLRAQEWAPVRER
jgi:hypothetical protein